MIAIFGRSSGLRLCKPTQEANRGSRRLQAGSRHGQRQCFSFANSVERPSLQGRRVPEELNPAIAWRLKARRKDSRLSSWKAASDLAALLSPNSESFVVLSRAGFQGGFRMGSELRSVGLGFGTGSERIPGGFSSRICVAWQNIEKLNLGFSVSSQDFAVLCRSCFHRLVFDA